MKTRALLSCLLLTVSLALISCAPAPDQPVALAPVNPELDTSGVMKELVSINGGAPLSLLQSLLKQGVPLKLAKAALLKYDLFSSRVTNTSFIVMVDMTQHSSRNRFYMVNRASGLVEAIPTAHGAGSDPDNSGYARYFSNVPDSKMSSLGAYLIQEKYTGKHGDSLRLDGLESTNSNARDRDIVLHAAVYVKDGQKRQGRSWGCPAIPTSWIKSAISRLANGTFMYIYGINQRDAVKDAFLAEQWRLIPKSAWVSESEDAPLEGD